MADSRFVGTVNLDDPASLSLALEKASDNQLQFFFKVAKSNKLEKARQLIVDEMINRRNLEKWWYT